MDRVIELEIAFFIGLWIGQIITYLSFKRATQQAYKEVMEDFKNGRIKP